MKVVAINFCNSEAGIGSKPLGREKNLPENQELLSVNVVELCTHMTERKQSRKVVV